MYSWLFTCRTHDKLFRISCLLQILTESKKETRRERKRREWLARKEERENVTLLLNEKHSAVGGLVKWNQDDKPQSEAEQGCWAYLPDLVLEYIFQLLPFKVSIQ
jgi:hypothetical protein